MKLLVLATDYPRQDKSIALMFIHSRNKYYLKNDIDVTVLNFRAHNNYIIDGVRVITLRDYRKNKDKICYGILISHAPNIRNHYLFLKKYEKYFSNIVFFFHGHEVLKTTAIYPEPYNYIKNKFIFSNIFRELYDILKLKIWSVYFIKILHKSYFIFVSNWLYEMFLKFIKIKPEKIERRKYIIYNCIGQNFENVSYDFKSEKKYDFITIRNNLDGSKYGIDIVTNIAEQNSKYKFCVIGKGNYYKYNKKPHNLLWLDRTLEHNEIINYLNNSKCALMPTRTDAQGVMACEMATFGIPLITSDIDVCKEVFGEFENVEYINNKADKIDIESFYNKIIMSKGKKANRKYFSENTVDKEIKMLTQILQKKGS